MSNRDIKKVTVELADGTELQFDKQVAVFAELEMSEIEKSLTDADGRLCGVMHCSTTFLAVVATHILDRLRKENPGVDAAVITNHIMSELKDVDLENKIDKLLEAVILDQKNE